MRRLLTALTITLAVGLWISLAGTSSAAPPPSTGHTATQIGQVHQVQPPPAPAADEATTGEQQSESDAATEGDTHEDPAGQNINHECPPNCDTANGEQP